MPEVEPPRITPCEEIDATFAGEMDQVIGASGTEADKTLERLKKLIEKG